MSKTLRRSSIGSAKTGQYHYLLALVGLPLWFLPTYAYYELVLAMHTLE